MGMEAEEVAAQLRCPHGEIGKQFGQVMNLRNLTMIVEALAQLDIHDGSRVLEVGCGNGGLLGHILSLAKGVRYAGVEISADMVEAAQAFNAPFLAAGLAEYVLLDDATEGLPFPEDSFDRALSVNTVYFQEDLGCWLGEMRRVLVPSGRLCLTFAERAFMRSLAFTRDGFHLVDGDEVVSVAGAQGWTLLRRVDRQDLAVSKDGELVERPFVHLVLEKGDERIPPN
ncbi:MAG: class I SAM-dependent methyltransferase [Arachnia propionica]|uniref:class I SAM-dependent methyltransferase n=1 Tax=Arachnia propionica TaxID=1750 RepID=UPI002707D9DE|nr:class I SAM-dependent methyltransferase [Arachnia propionica]